MENDFEFVCERCGNETTEGLHACPYAIDICDCFDEMCNCCDDCVRECCDDI